jgi:hypothetical protein
MPINPLQLPEPVRSPHIDFSALGKIGDAIAAHRRKSAIQDAITSATDDQGNVNYGKAGAALSKIGALEEGRSMLALAESKAQAARAQANTDRDFTFRKDEAGRAQQNADRSYGLQRDQFNQQQAQNPWMPTPEGGVQPRPGGSADPAYIQRVNEAKKPGGSFEDEQKLRKEFESNAKTHLDVRRGFQRVLASKDDAAGDISLIFGYMKMLDPGSVVREGEFATAQNAAGIPDMVRNMYNRALEGTRLNADQRTMFKGQAQSLYDASSKEYDAREKQFRDIATRYNVDPTRVLPSLGPEPQVPMRPGAPEPALNLPPLPPGFILNKR